MIPKYTNRKFVHVYSGGLDSTVLLFDLLKGGNKVHCLNLIYGSKHNEAESKFALQNCRERGVKIDVVSLPEIAMIFNSTLFKGGGAIPHGSYTDENMKSTVVPFRNGILLSLAAGFCESMKYDAISYAAHAGDHAIYPDCQPSFVNSMGEAIMKGTHRRIKLATPYLHMNKAEIVKRGNKLNVDFSKTWTCYEGNVLKGHCGKCGACQERREAFFLACVGDHTKYQS